MVFFAKIYGICNMDYLWSELRSYSVYTALKSRVIRLTRQLYTIVLAAASEVVYLASLWPRRQSYSKVYGPERVVCLP